MSFHSSTRGMLPSKFRRAAIISSFFLINKKSLGDNILKACQKCFLEFNSNYNLGIILLCAPIIKAFSTNLKSVSGLRKNLFSLISNIDIEEPNKILKAIKISKPGGIKNFKHKGDINNLATNELSFMEIMKIGSERDRISNAYNDFFSEIFEIGLPYLRKKKKKFNNIFSIECLYLKYLSISLDSHILRKYGKITANSVSFKAKELLKKIENHNSLESTRELKNFDYYLKFRNINPGTCADLTVTTLLIEKITDIIKKF